MPERINTPQKYCKNITYNSGFAFAARHHSPLLYKLILIFGI